MLIGRSRCKPGAKELANGVAVDHRRLVLLSERVLADYLDGTGRTKSLTQLVASIGRAPAFVLGLLIFGALLWAAWRVDPAIRTKHLVVKAATGA